MALVGIGAPDRRAGFAKMKAMTLAQPCQRGAGDRSPSANPDFRACFVAVIALTTNVAGSPNVIVAFAPGCNGRHAGSGADAAHRSDLRRRASSVAPFVFVHHCDGPGIVHLFGRAAGRCRRLASLGPTLTMPHAREYRGHGPARSAHCSRPATGPRNFHCTSSQRITFTVSSRSKRLPALPRLPTGPVQSVGPWPKMPFDAGVIGCERGGRLPSAGGGENDEARKQHRARRFPFAAASRGQRARAGSADNRRSAARDRAEQGRMSNTS